MSDKIVKVLALTGGPCAGKTSAIPRVSRELSERGWGVIVVPETATELINGGIRPNEMGTVPFQTMAMGHQADWEDMARQAAELHPSGKVAILCDRGIPDQCAYMSEEEFGEVSAAVGLTRDDIMSRYDAVVHLRSAAVGAEEAYTRSNNAARTETVEEARAADERTLSQWSAHPHLAVVGNHGTFDEKLDELSQVVGDLVGEPYAVESQRKLLVEMPGPEWFDGCDEHVVGHVRTAYLADGQGGEERRVRRVEHDGLTLCTMTRRRDVGPGLERETVERMVSADEFEDLVADAVCGNDKVRHSFVADDVVGVIDDYGDGSGLAVMELRGFRGLGFPRVPDGIRVVRDVTGDRALRNRSLAEAGGATLAEYAGEGLGNDMASADETARAADGAEAPKEIEVKLLLDDVDEGRLRDLCERVEGASVTEITQTYLDVDMPGETRLRERRSCDDVTYVVTNKQDVDGGLTRIENEWEVSVSEAAEYLSHADPSMEPIRKTRYSIPDGERMVEVDVYADGSAVAEVELSEGSEADRAVISGDRQRVDVLPRWVPATVVADVTEMGEFKNSSLAKGFPEGGLVAMYREMELVSKEAPDHDGGLSDGASAQHMRDDEFGE